MSKEIIRVGLDIGNKNLKVCADHEQSHEIAIAYREVSKWDYENESVGQGMEKVKYNNKYYFVGQQCQSGLPANKGDSSHREMANMFKLVGLARELRRQGINKGDFYVVTGTPVLDFEAYKSDYIDLIITKNKEYEEIEINGEKYKIKVLNTVITKQSACIAPTIPGWKEKEFVIVDFGGGTLDIAHFVNGAKKKYDTINFSLNEILTELGNILNGYKLGLPRPDSLDSGFISIMENIVQNGRYRYVDSITISDKQIGLQEFVSKHLQKKIDNIMKDIKIKLKISDTDAQYVDFYFIGGGAKLLYTELLRNKTFRNKKVIENPHFANVEAYFKLANSKRWE